MFKQIVDKIEKNKSSPVNFIPFPLEKFSRVLPGVLQSCYYIVTANSGVGKSQLTKYLFILNPIEFAKKNGIDLRIFYFSLEESKEKFFLSLISNKLNSKYGIEITPRELLSYSVEGKVTDDIIKKIRSLEKEVSDYSSYLQVHENIRNPTGIYKTVRKNLANWGKFYYKDKEVFPHKNNWDVQYDKYVKNDLNQFVIIITDHISLLGTEKPDATSTHLTMSKWSSDYCIKLRNTYHCTIVNVQQQSSVKEQLEFTNIGKSIEAKLQPSLEGLGDNKLCGRDADIVLGLFAPHRYEIENYKGFNIGELQDSYRELSILKDRDGVSNVRKSLKFNGAINHFEELERNELSFLN